MTRAQACIWLIWPAILAAAICAGGIWASAPSRDARVPGQARKRSAPPLRTSEPAFFA